MDGIMRIKLFADGAYHEEILKMAKDPRIKGFTTNPTLMQNAGITDYEAFAREILAAVPYRPFSFEVFSDEFNEMERQAKLIAAWGPNVYVKIPITNTRRESSIPLIKRLVEERIKLNVTAVMTADQVRNVCWELMGGPPSIVSVFAGRIADTGRDPIPIMEAAKRWTATEPNVELLWASPREALNIYQAEAVGCEIITITPPLLHKLDLANKNLDDYSLETVQMFRRDAVQAGFVL